MNRKFPPLTKKQEWVFRFLLDHEAGGGRAPTLDELCGLLKLNSRGSLHKHVTALIDAGLVAPLNHQHRGVRLTPKGRALAPEAVETDTLPLLGYIAAGRPIEAVSDARAVSVPPQLRTQRECYVLQVRGDSMQDEGILDGDWVVIEQRETARNGEIVVALVRGEEATLKRIEQRPEAVVLHSANPAYAPMTFAPDEITIQGVLVGQMRTYH